MVTNRLHHIAYANGRYFCRFLLIELNCIDFLEKVCTLMLKNCMQLMLMDIGKISLFNCRDGRKFLTIRRNLSKIL